MFLDQKEKTLKSKLILALKGALQKQAPFYCKTSFIKPSKKAETSGLKI